MREKPLQAARLAPFAVLGIALLATSHGAIFARLAQADALAIAAWRLGIASLVVIPLAAASHGWRRSAPGRGVVLAAAAGALLAVHFAAWIASLEQTSIARSVLLVSTAPIWVAVIEILLGRGAPRLPTALALACATGGAAILGGARPPGPAALAGDLLAIIGAIAMAAYLLLSREAQLRLPFRAYLGVAYGSAALLLWLAVCATGTPARGFGPGTWWALVGMAVVSQLIGHGGYNWSLRQLSPLYVGVVLVGEPVIASVLAWYLLGEELDPGTGAGGLLILAGILLGAAAARRPGV